MERTNIEAISEVKKTNSKSRRGEWLPKVICLVLAFVIWLILGAEKTASGGENAEGASQSAKTVRTEELSV